MKKLISIVLLVICSFGLWISNVNAIDLPEVTDHEKVKIYLFRSSSCGYCHNFIKYFSDQAVKYNDYFEIISYEVSSSTSNSALKSVITEDLEVPSTGVPLIVIGDEYKIGFGDSDGEAIIEQALNEYQSEEYYDYVAQKIDEEDLDHDPETFMEACDSAGVKCIDDLSKAGISDGLIIAIVFVVIIGGFVALVVTSRKKA